MLIDSNILIYAAEPQYDIDRQQGIFDLKPYLNRNAFRELKNIHYFNQVGILFLGDFIQILKR